MHLPKILTFLFSITFSVAFIFYGLEVISYAGFIENNIGVNIVSIAGISLFLLLLLRFVKPIPVQWSAFLFSGATASFVLGAAFILLDKNIYANFIYSTLHMNPEQFFSLGFFLAISALISITRPFLKQYARLLLFLLSFWLFPLAFYFKMYNDELFHSLAREDSVVEYSTMLVYLLTSIIGFFSLRLIYYDKTHQGYPWLLYCIIYTLITVGMFVIAGEEISWAQRIIGFETPEAVGRNNNQFEFNLHNQGLVQPFVFYMYALISLYGITAFPLIKTFSALIPSQGINRFLRFFSPSPLLIGFLSRCLFLVQER